MTKIDTTRYFNSPVFHKEVPAMKSKDFQNSFWNPSQRWLVILLAVCFMIMSGGCSGNDSGNTASGYPSNPLSTGSSTTSPVERILLQGTGDSADNPLSSITTDLNGMTVQLLIDGQDYDSPTGVLGANPAVVANSNNPKILDVAVVDEDQQGAKDDLALTPRSPGWAGIVIEVPSIGIKRLIGVEVKNPDGSDPGLPNYIAIGARDDMPNINMNLWEHMPVNIRYTYLNGGVDGTRGWYIWGAGAGTYAKNFVTDSKKVGMIPVLVYYQMCGGDEESDKIAFRNINDSSFMQLYFKDYVRALQRISSVSGGDPVYVVMEPDLLGYMMQNHSGSDFSTRPGSITAQVTAAYNVTDDSNTPILKAGEVPGVAIGSENTIRGYVLTMNYLATKYAPDVHFGWKFNIWCTAADGRDVPKSGLVHFTDKEYLGIPAGRNRIKSEAGLIAKFYIDAGIKENGATFIFFDRYGFDGGGTSPSTPDTFGWKNPAKSAWFWNMVLWNNYVLIVKTVHDQIGLPVGLWQMPGGHINGSRTVNTQAQLTSIPLNSYFPDLLDLFPVEYPPDFYGDTRFGSWEDATPTCIFGDTLKISTENGGNGVATGGLTEDQVKERITFFGMADPDDPDGIKTDGDTIVYGRHTPQLKDAGVVMIMFGPGVGGATGITGWDGTDKWSYSPPRDNYWWLNKVYQYYDNPEKL